MELWIDMLASLVHMVLWCLETAKWLNGNSEPHIPCYTTDAVDVFPREVIIIGWSGFQVHSLNLAGGGERLCRPGSRRHRLRAPRRKGKRRQTSQTSLAQVSVSAIQRSSKKKKWGGRCRKSLLLGSIWGLILFLSLNDAGWICSRFCAKCSPIKLFTPLCWRTNVCGTEVSGLLQFEMAPS
jgi:hypothetical protein